MTILRDISLKGYNTFGLDYKADFLVLPESEAEILLALSEKKGLKKPFLILGGGSNILFTSDFHGTVIKPTWHDICVEKINDEHAIISSDAGVNWDYFVEWCVTKNLGGIENLSLIPGNVGAAPVQNIGAYGTEIRDHVQKVRTISLQDGSVREFSATQCEFNYRSSVFKTSLKGQYIVSKVYFRLDLNAEFRLNYGLVNEEVKKLGEPSLKTIRKAIINIRRSKLPDPEQIGNAGSFFKNPVIDKNTAAGLKVKYPQMPLYPESSGDIKIPAGWLIEQCGWKGKMTGNVLVHEKQALVITNPGKASGKEIFDVSEEIRRSVVNKFGITLEREVEVIGTT